MEMKEYRVFGHEPSLLPAQKDWELVWSDEFDGIALDTSKWGFRMRFWGHDFSPPFTTEGVVVNGNSELEIHLIEREGHYFSAQLQTGENSWDNLILPSDKIKYKDCGGIWPLRPLEKPKYMHGFGYYECRCKFQRYPEAWWSAFWLQSPSIGITYDPTFSGIECDIMECFKSGLVTAGNIFGGYCGDEQYRNDGRVKDIPLAVTDGDWHRFGVDWNESGYVFYADGAEISRTDGKFVSRVEQFILLTTECYGYRHGDMEENKHPSPRLSRELLPDKFTVDYVRVFDSRQ